LEQLDKANVVIEKRFTSYLNKREKENNFSEEIALLITVEWCNNITVARNHLR